jgi:hypothetical protein
VTGDRRRRMLAFRNDVGYLYWYGKDSQWRRTGPCRIRRRPRACLRQGAKRCRAMAWAAKADRRPAPVYPGDCITTADTAWRRDRCGSFRHWDPSRTSSGVEEQEARTRCREEDCGCCSPRRAEGARRVRGDSPEDARGLGEAEEGCSEGVISLTASDYGAGAGAPRGAGLGTSGTLT